MGRFGVWTLAVLIAIMALGYVRPGFAQPAPAPPGSICLEHPNRPLIIARKPCGPNEGPTGTSIYLGSCCTDVCDGTDMGQTQCPSFSLPSPLTVDIQGCRYWIHERFGYRLLAACPQPGSGGGTRARADDFDSSTAISGASGRREGSSVGASIESGEPNHAGNSGGASVWWTWTAPATGEVTFDTHGSNFDTLLAVYTGASLNRLTEVASNDDTDGSLQSEVSFAVERGQAYHIAVDGYGGATGVIELNWWLAPMEVGPAAPLREQVFDDAGKTVYVVAGDNGSLQYWMDSSGIVEQSLYESAEGTQRVRTFYDEATGAPRTVLNEVSGHWLSIRGPAPGRVDFSAYDGHGSYLDGFAIYEKSGQYFTGEFVGTPADGPTVDVEDGLTDVQEVPPEVATLIDVLTGGGPSLPTLFPTDRQADADTHSLHSGLTQGGLKYVNRGLRLLARPGGQVAGAYLATAGAGAFFAAQFLPDIANGIRTKFGRDCPPAGSIEGQMCADLTNLAADNLSRRGTTGPIGYLRHVEDWIRNSPSYLRNWIARGASSLRNIILGLLPGDPVRERANAEPAPRSTSQLSAFIPSDAEVGAFFPSDTSYVHGNCRPRSCSGLYNCYRCSALYNSYRCSELYNSYRCSELYNSYSCSGFGNACTSTLPTLN